MTDMVPAGGRYGTALEEASNQGNLGIVTLLLERGADPNTQRASDVIPSMYDYGTALQAAAASYHENLNVVTLLLRKGADLNAQGSTFAILRIYH
jgi:ankyrin repeat protein